MVDEKLIRNLRKKGWSEEEIEKTARIMQRFEAASENRHKKLNVILYWSVLFIAIIGNFILSVVLIPFMLVLSNYQLYFIIMIIAVAFGLLFNLIIRDIEYLDRKHHVIAGIFIPTIAIINVSIMVNVSNNLMRLSKINNVPQNPIAISIIYVVFFVLPYMIYNLLEIKDKKNANKRMLKSTS